MGGEMALLKGKDRQHVVGSLAADLFVQTAARDVAVEFFGQIGRRASMVSWMVMALAISDRPPEIDCSAQSSVTTSVRSV